MKPSLLYLSFMCILLLVSMACASVDAGVEWGPTPSALMPTALASPPISEGTISPMIDLTSAPTATLRPTVTPTPTRDLLVEGGFVDNPVDIALLPEYSEPARSYHGDSLQTALCPDVFPAQTVALVDEWLVYKRLCVYGLPDPKDGVQFTIKLFSPSSKTYTADFSAHQGGSDNFLSVYQDRPNPDEFNPGGLIEMDLPGTPAGYSLSFPLTQDYGLWRVEATSGGEIFAAGTVDVTTSRPIASVTRKDDPLDPFALFERPLAPVSGDHVVFAERGLEPGRKLTLALYAIDAVRTGNGVNVFTPRYATQITVDEEGAYAAEFVFGSETPVVTYAAVEDPQPSKFYPNYFAWLVEQP